LHRHLYQESEEDAVALLDDLKAAKNAVTEAVVESDVTKNVVDQLVEIGEGAKEYADMAKGQVKEQVVAVKEQVPELAAKAEEIVAAGKRQVPKAAAALGAVVAAGAVVGGLIFWKRRGAPTSEPAEQATDIVESEDGIAQADVADEELEEAAAAADEAETADEVDVADDEVDVADEDTEPAGDEQGAR
jgi:hypothetical protein